MATVLAIPHHVSPHLAVREVELARAMAARVAAMSWLSSFTQSRSALTD